MDAVTPVTKELLADLPYGTVFHYSPACRLGGNCERWRTNGQLKTWKTRPDEFRQPIKHGLRDYSYITHHIADQFVLERECPNGHW
jgi:hypothetical protein